MFVGRLIKSQYIEDSTAAYADAQMGKVTFKERTWVLCFSACRLHLLKITSRS